MVTLQIHLLFLTALGTISRCEMASPYPDSVAIEAPSSPSFSLSSCKKSSVNVRFLELKVKGSDSDVVYRRTTVADSHLQFWTNATVNLTGTDLFECAKATAGEGLEAFLFEGNCTGYRLDQRFYKCQTGDNVLYVRQDYLKDEIVVVPFEEAPYKLVDFGGSTQYRQYMLSAIVKAAPSELLLVSSFSEVNDTVFEEAFPSYNIITPENEDVIQAGYQFIDMNFCLVDGPYGIPIYVSPLIFDSPFEILFVYFLNECGKTVLRRSAVVTYVFSHEGMGCTYFPSEAPNECAVTFQGDPFLDAQVLFFPTEAENGYAGFNMTFTTTASDGSEATGSVLTEDAFPIFEGGPFTKLTLSIQDVSTKPTVGFIVRIDFYEYE